MLRKIEAMYAEFGRRDIGKCGKCDHLICGVYHDRHYSKCLLYGASHSAATDWAKGWCACGMYNKEPENGYIPLLRRMTREKQTPAQIDGQMDILDGGADNDQR